MYPLIISIILLAIAILIIALLSRRFGALSAERDALKASQDALAERFKGVIDADAERSRILISLQRDRDEAIASGEREKALQRQETEKLQALRSSATAELTDVQSQIAMLRRELQSLDEESTLQSFGFYKPRYQFVDSAHYQAELERIRDAQKEMIKSKTAATCGIAWTVNGSKVEGRKQISQTLNLMLRAFNGECDAAVAKVKFNNVGVMEARIQKASPHLPLSAHEPNQRTQGIFSRYLG